ncbi:TonB family protein [Ekhidna sp.]|uniref:TonB family protein n=1 Tax=Ekhidna sp. TaxID=2608089 RepID=UPI003B5B05F5
MSPEEAHAFEREVLDDPFAQEALEGFEEQNADALKDLTHLRSRIRREKKKAWSWMRMAAVVALLMVGYFTVYFFTEQMEGEQLAMEKEPIEEHTQSGPKPDTIPASKEIPEDEASSKEVGNKVKELEEREEILAKKPAPEVEEREALAMSDDVDEVGQLEGKGEALQLAEAEDIEKEVVIEPMTDEMIVMEEEVVVPIQSFSAKKIEAIEEVNSDQPAAARSAARSSGATIAEMNDRESIEIIPPKPSFGDSLYQEYLKQELIYPKAAKENNIEGEVILSLTISEFGEILDIKIEKSLGYGCDEEAIRLVKEGPAWNAAKKDGSTIEGIATVRVNFQFD